MNSLNVENIVDVQISVSKTVASATRFGHMLIICPAPKTPGSASTPPVGAYSALTALEELETAGFTDADPVYGAMQMVLKANKLPDIVYVAVQQNTSSGVEKISETLQRLLGHLPGGHFQLRFAGALGSQRSRYPWHDAFCRHYGHW